MKEKIDRTLQSCKELMIDIKLTAKKFEWSKTLRKCGILGVALVKVVPVGAVIIGVAFAFCGNTFPGMTFTITGMAATPFFWSCVIVSPDQEHQLVVRKNHVEAAITVLKGIHITVDELISFKTSSIGNLEAVRGCVEMRLDI
jgi:hypothetical protein